MITEQQAIELKPGDKIKHKQYGVCGVGGVGRYSGGVFAFIRVYIDADVSHSVESLDKDCYLRHNNLPSNDSINDSVWVYLRGTLSVEVSDLSMFDMLEPDEVGFDTGFKTELGNAIMVGDTVQWWPDNSTMFISTIGVSVIGIGGIEHVVIPEVGGKATSLDSFGYELTVVEQGIDKYGRKYKKEL